MHLLIAIVLIAGSSSYAPGSTDVNQHSPAPLPITSSPLNGNWKIAGDRKKEQFPLLSIFLQVDGTQIVAQGDVDVRCPNDPREGRAARGFGLRGDIATDGTFSLRNYSTRDTIQVEIRGRVPGEAAATWNGDYTVTQAPSPKCPAFQQTQASSFTATPLASVDGTFSGSLTMNYFKSSPPGYNGPQSYEATFSVTVTQGSVVSHTLKDGHRHFYLPLVGTIRVKGSSCFSRGFADPVTYETHISVPSSPSTLQGDFLVLRFAMNDESSLVLRAVFADPSESALSVFDAAVAGGKCENQTFHGSLERRP